MSERVEIYADGSCAGNPGPGGWGAVLKSGKHEKRIGGAHPEVTTNQRMELVATIEALKALKIDGLKVTIYTDAKYVQKGITEWIKGWKERNWHRVDKKPVANADLWQELDELTTKHDVTWEWVPGHAGVLPNEIADAIAYEHAHGK